jgi:hypothetical protein
MAGLTPQQEKFAQLVSLGNTYADAYRGAYKVGEKTKLETIWCESSKLMSNPMVSQRVREIQEETIKNNQVTLEEVIKELSEWLRFDPIEFFDDNNCMKNMRDLSPIARKQIADIKVQELWGKDGEKRVKIGEIKSIKFLDKQSTVDKFMKYFGAYVTNVKLDVEDLSHLKDLLNGIAK